MEDEAMTEAAQKQTGKRPSVFFDPKMRAWVTETGQWVASEAEAVSSRFEVKSGPPVEPLSPLGETLAQMRLQEFKKFESGAVRSAEAESVRYDLISPIGLRAVAETCAYGARKYSDFNWEKGMPATDILNHAINHIYKFLEGDRSEPHLPHAAWNLLAAIHSLELWPHLNEGTLREPGCLPPKPKTEAK